ncbi:recombinase RecT [Acinetobacter sp. B5B]|uniref:RecT family recombinase n=1 Tax=Acinetobacter TaxID=469 RepID=UPI0018A2CFA6|nr:MULTISPECIES: RecT family recombinase [Acinetobacter]MBF7683013.1 recombinase RecT [Acinetobacter baretiae]MBF7696164.1 recombinase RecT [Acinetobacter rathckeae]
MNSQAKTIEAQTEYSPNAIASMDVMLNDEAMQRVNSLAQVMSTSRVTIPKHLQGSVGDCFAVILQSMQWGMNPFAVAQKTHLVNGVLGYEAQLVNAVITTRAPITGRLQFEWYGDWSKVNGKVDKSHDKGIKVWATMKGEDEPRLLDLSLAQVGDVRNSPLWLADPRQQLAYLAVKRWSRLYCPDVILGVYTPDEFNESPERDITPNNEVKANSGSSALKARLAKNKVVNTPLDLTPYKERISNAESYDELKQVGVEVKALGLGEPEHTDMATLYKSKLSEFVVPDSEIKSIVNALDNAKSVEELASILETRFEPFTSKMTDKQIDLINKSFDAQEAALSE